MTTKNAIIEAFIQDLTSSTVTFERQPTYREPCQKEIKQFFENLLAPALIVKAWLQTHPLDYLPAPADYLLFKSSVLIYSGGYNKNEIKSLIKLAKGTSPSTQDYTEYLFDYLKKEKGDYIASLKERFPTTGEDYLKRVLIEHLFEELFPRDLNSNAELEHHVPSPEILELLDLPPDWTPFKATRFSYWNYGLIHQGFEPPSSVRRSRQEPSSAEMQARTGTGTRGGELLSPED